MTTTKTLKTLPVNTELINDASFDDWGQCLANLKFEASGLKENWNYV